ncbi:hypothetical protein HN51_016359 [Arachis hypogaea]|uniref:LOB domain-containing protein n=1 Tax=Arachis hypogaea TaxID=3818 RepID=A0A445CS90_ARAHY|nr:LOB domain-containing protein 20 [Arachis hypogaea]QHO46903.1 LOB domain-containing protein [Arachis hypogaea]RYR53839.1 hypothetical protein Ahy_A06g029087 [Arachis hypogaea]
MSERQGVGDHGTNSGTRRKGAATKRAMAVAAAATVPPCGACKFLRRKCISGCIFAPHFGSDQGAARFAAVHKVFGASNVSKLLLHIPVNRRHEAVVTISYEAQARLSDPVYGCVSTILALQQQVASLQGELSMVQNQLINSRFAYANVLHQCTQQHHHHHHHDNNQPNMINVSLLQQPAYSNNNSSASTNNNLVNMNTFNNNNNNNHSGFELAMEAAPSSPPHSFEPLRLSRENNDEDDEEESIIIPQLFNHEIVLHRQ